jgi:hypothetical protein
MIHICVPRTGDWQLNHQLVGGDKHCWLNTKDLSNKSLHWIVRLYWIEHLSQWLHLTAMHPHMLDTHQSWIPSDWPFNTLLQILFPITCLLVAYQLAGSDYKICTVCRPAQLSHSWIRSLHSTRLLCFSAKDSHSLIPIRCSLSTAPEL